jgi:hypothetical protein
MTHQQPLKIYAPVTLKRLRSDIAASENKGRKLTAIAVVVPLCENLKRTTRCLTQKLTLAGLSSRILRRTCT